MGQMRANRRWGNVIGYPSLDQGEHTEEKVKGSKRKKSLFSKVHSQGSPEKGKGSVDFRTPRLVLKGC